MDFYSVLESCYKRDMEAFLLYCTMSDACKGDLQLKEETLRLYNIYKQRDIFYEISLCRKDRFEAILNRYDGQNRNCLLCVAKLLRPDWGLPFESAEKAQIKAREKKVNAVVRKQVSPQTQAGKTALPTNTMPVPPTPKPKAVKKPRKPRKVESIFISGLLSDYLVETSANVTDVEVTALKNGTWSSYKTYSLRATSPLLINLDALVADKVKISIPQEKFAYLSVSKAHGNVKIVDCADCFRRLGVNVEVGKVQCLASPKSLTVVCRAAEISVTQMAKQAGEIDIRNTLGDVHVALHNVSQVEKNLTAVHGNVVNTHVPSMIGYKEYVKIVTVYGNVNIT